MDEWITTKARNAQVQATASVWVCCSAAGQVIGVFAFDHITIAATDMGVRNVRGLPKARAILVARFALHLDFRGQQLGPSLMMEVMRAAVIAKTFLPAALLVLDAKNNKLAEWYSKIGFVPMITDPMRHFMPMAKVESSIAEADAATLESVVDVEQSEIG